MDRRMIGVTGFLVLALAGLPLLAPMPVAAQQDVSGRFRVLVPDLEARQNADRKFGEKVAEELRDLLNELPTHQPVQDKEVRDALRKFKIDREDLNCIRARQLAGQIDAQLVMCGAYQSEGGGYAVSSSFVSADNGESFEVPGVTVGDKGEEQAAQHIFNAFEAFVDQLRFAAFCNEYFQSQQWDNALTNCNRAIDLNPGAVSSRYTRARTYMEMGRNDEGLAELKHVLELNPIHENALQSAGYLAAQMGLAEEARGYYSDYLELNPANAAVRMKVAYDLATAGDPEGAMQLIEEGIEMDPENIALHEQLGGFAFTAAGKKMEEVGGDQITPEIQSLYRKAIAAYERVAQAKGAEMQPSQLGNIIAAYVQLGDLDGAVGFAEKAVQTHPGDASLWSRYADALQRNNRLSDAIAALDKAKAADPNYPNLAARQGSWLMGAGRIDEAMPYLKQAVDRGEQPADMMATMVFGKAYNDGIQKKNYGFAIDVLGKAKEFEVSEKMKSQLDFWHAYALYNRGLALQEPQTVESARTSLPLFRQALTLFQSGRAYAATVESINISQFLEATNTYIEIQDAIIKRGR